MKYFLSFCFLFCFAFSFSQETQRDTLLIILQDSEVIHLTEVEVQNLNLIPENLLEENIKVRREHPRLVAAILCLTLGPFGAHRLYLGTKPSVPVAYTLTLGGGLGVLPVIDLVIICFSRDLSKYKNNPHVLMWVPKEN